MCDFNQIDGILDMEGFFSIFNEITILNPIY